MIWEIVALGAWHFLAVIPAGWLALIGTVLGTIGLKVLEKFLNRNSEQANAKREDRRDYNAEIKDLVARVDGLEDEVENWRKRFYEQQEYAFMVREILIKNGITLPEQAVGQPPDKGGK